MTTLLAATRLMPSEPAFVEMRSNLQLKQRRIRCIVVIIYDYLERLR